MERDGRGKRGGKAGVGGEEKGHWGGKRGGREERELKKGE